MIDSIMDFLERSYMNEGYFIKEFSNNVYFGKDKNGNCVCVKKDDLNVQPFSLKTDSIELYQNYSFTFQSEGETIEGNYDMIVLMRDYCSSKRSFVNLCLNFYSSEDDRSIVELTEDLIELYKVSKKGDSKREQGLWAELFVIIFLNECYGVNVIENWHSDSYNKYDFSITNNVKLEVKSTLKEIREHKFSHEQVYTGDDVVISSVMLRQDDSGVTLIDLYNKILTYVSSYSFISKMEKELVKFDTDSMMKFDYEYALSNIKFYLNKRVPNFDKPEPEGVHSTEYYIVLEHEDTLSKEEVIDFLNK